MTAASIAARSSRSMADGERRAPTTGVVRLVVCRLLRPRRRPRHPCQRADRACSAPATAHPARRRAPDPGLARERCSFRSRGTSGVARRTASGGRGGGRVRDERLVVGIGGPNSGTRLRADGVVAADRWTRRARDRDPDWRPPWRWPAAPPWPRRPATGRRAAPVPGRRSGGSRSGTRRPWTSARSRIRNCGSVRRARTQVAALGALHGTRRSFASAPPQAAAGSVGEGEQLSLDVGAQPSASPFCGSVGRTVSSAASASRR